MVLKACFKRCSRVFCRNMFSSAYRRLSRPFIIFSQLVSPPSTSLILASPSLKNAHSDVSYRLVTTGELSEIGKFLSKG